MPTATPTTKPSTPRLSDVARHVVVPPDAVTTGWPSIRKKCAELGISFRWWQHPIGQIILAKRADGKYASTIGGTGLSIPRQVGKTFLVGAIMFALCLLNPNLTVIWSAHRLRTAEETFKKMQAMANRAAVKPFIQNIIRGSGEEAIEFTNGSRILFGARAAGFGRGFDEVDVVVYDEAQILGENALDDMVPAMNQSRQASGALLLFMGTPPKPTDNGEIFTRMRTEALSGEDEDTAWIEFGSDPGYVPTLLPGKLTEADWAQVAKANPSYPDDTPREAILRMRKKLGSDSFLREGLGIWDEDDRPSIFPSWPDLIGDPAEPEALGVAADPALTNLSLGIFGDGFVDAANHVPISERAGFVKEVAEMSKATGLPVALQQRGPAWVLLNDLKAAGALVAPIPFEGFVQACADWDDAITSASIRHPNSEALTSAVRRAEWRTVGDRRVISRKTGDISGLEAVILARHIATTPPPVPRVYSWADTEED